MTSSSSEIISQEAESMSASDHIMNCSMYSRRLHQTGTPEGEFNNFECFQNYTASEVFVQGLAGIVNQSDVETMIRAQKHMLQRFEKTNEMLLNCNALSASRLQEAMQGFKRHSKLIGDMKKDLEYVFRKIRIIRSKMQLQYPKAYMTASQSVSTSSITESTDNTIRTTAFSSGNLSNVAVAAEKRHKLGGGSSSNNRIGIDYVQIAEQSPLENACSELPLEEHIPVDGTELCLHDSRQSFGSSTDNSGDSSDTN